MTLQDHLALARRHFMLLLFSVAIGVAVSAIYVLLRPPVYEANATAYVASYNGNSVGEAYSGNLLAQAKAKAYVPLVTGREVAIRVIEKLKLTDSPEALAQRISAKNPLDSNLIEVTATGPSPQAANALASATVNAAAAEVKQVESLIKPANSAPQTPPVALVPVENASLPTSPVSPNPRREIPLGAILGLLVGYSIALILRVQDTKIRTVQEAEATTGSSVIGVIPQSEPLQHPDRSLPSGIHDFHTNEALRQLRTNLRYVDVDHDPRSIVVTSAGLGEGKSTVAAALAWMLADSGEPVVLIDGDLRRPAVAGIFALDPVIGLTQVLAGSIDLEDAIQRSGHDGLLVLTAGETPPNPSELVGSQRMHELITKLATTHRVIIDAPPLLPVTDGALLTASSDGALLVIAANEAREEQVQRAIRNIESVKGRLLGVVLNRVVSARVRRSVYGDEAYGYTPSVAPASERSHGRPVQLDTRSQRRVAKAG